MGIVNLTPDSFFEGSRTGAAEALSRIRELFCEGADVVDLGACSTRPGGALATLEEEWERLEPVLREVGASGGVLGSAGSVSPGGPEGPFGGLALSIDTFRPEVVRRAFDIIGPFIVNDVSGGSDEMIETVDGLHLPYVATHNRPFEGGVVEDVCRFCSEFGERAARAGIADWILDPGFGFSKTTAQNHELLRRLEEVVRISPVPVMVGLSRKSMITKVLDITPEEALTGTQILGFAALERGALWLRVHDVAEALRTVRLFTAFSGQSV